MTTYLLDANVLIALTVTDHEHHDDAARWMSTVEAFAICPMVEGALARFLLRVGESAATAAAMLDAVRTHPRCAFWPDDVSYADIDVSRLRGHRQVTDTYLVALATAHDGELATFDKALASRHQRGTVRIPRAALR